MKYALCISLSFFILVSSGFSQDKILFIRGGSGTGGFLEGGADDQLSSIYDYSTKGWNHGWGQFADVLKLEGFELEQKSEGAKNNNTPVDIIKLNLDLYKVIVFGSNNASYSARAVDSLLAYIMRGGSALFISDANWGQNWGDAPSSDQAFLTPLGWKMNQDQGTYTLYSSNFKDKNHLILQNVSSFDGEGVSPITLENDKVAGVQSTILAPAKNQVRRNTGMSKGPSQSPTSKDASLIVAELGEGRVAGHFDRNTFFNTNGAGSNIHKNSNKQYAINLFKWLAGKHINTTIDVGVLQEIKVLGNPAKGFVRLMVSAPISYIKLFDLQGRSIDFDYNGEGRRIMEIRPKVSQDGLLLIQIVSGKQITNMKVMYQP